MNEPPELLAKQAPPRSRSRKTSPAATREKTREHGTRAPTTRGRGTLRKSIERPFPSNLNRTGDHAKRQPDVASDRMSEELAIAA